MVVQHLASVPRLVRDGALDVADELLRELDDELDEVVRGLVVAQDGVHAGDVAEKVDGVFAVQKRLDVADVRVDNLLRILGKVLKKRVVEDDGEGKRRGRSGITVRRSEGGRIVDADASKLVDERARDSVASVDDTVLCA